ncbi:hypothetical protein [Streptomyces sp. NPDC004728]|uniref:hypothetical protein n=1 Tax=Streptomyces sp. NPDC004728 TaxID=3154289 RepID=UPI0033B7B2BE
MEVQACAAFRPADAPEALIVVQAPVGPAGREPVSRPVPESRGAGAEIVRIGRDRAASSHPVAATTSASAQKEHSSA